MGLSTVHDRPAADLRDDRDCRAAAARDSAASVRDLDSAASGAARCCSRWRTRRRASARGTACFPQLGAPIGFLFSGGVFLILSAWLTDERFFSFGWRLPFLASAVLVVLGLYVRLTIAETPVFREAMTRHERVKLPMLAVLRDHPRTLDPRRARRALGFT